MNRRAFLGALGVFSILPGAGRVWKAIRDEPVLIREYRITTGRAGQVLVIQEDPRHAFFKTMFELAPVPEPEAVESIEEVIFNVKANTVGVACECAVVPKMTEVWL